MTAHSTRHHTHTHCDFYLLRYTNTLTYLLTYTYNMSRGVNLTRILRTQRWIQKAWLGRGVGFTRTGLGGGKAPPQKQMSFSLEMTFFGEF